MTRLPRSARALTGAITLTCFGIGFTGAYGAHALDTRIAVGDARAAAQELEVKRAALEESLSEAHGAVRDAGEVVDESTVAAAAQALSSATQTAADHAARSGVVVDIAPIEADDLEALSEATRDDAPASEPQAVTRDVDPDAREQDPNAGGSSMPRDSAPPTPEATSSEAPPTSSALVDLREEMAVARVLAGDTDSADEARAAAHRLEDASRALDVALAALDGGASALSTAALEAAHDETLLLLDAAVESADEAAAQAPGTIAATEGRVLDDAPIAAARSALTLLMSGSATATLVDRGEPQRVVEELDQVVAAQAVFDAAMAGLRDTHEDWIVRENASIQSRNDSLREQHELQVASARDDHAQANRDAVAARANGWTGRPDGVSGTNGSLAFDGLCELDFAPGHRLQCDAARSLDDANDAYAAQTGRQLTMTDSYRSFSLQVRTRALKPTTAARPGTSNHGWGMAVDLDRPSAIWLAENGPDYGWANPTWAKPNGVRPEWWHLEYLATDVGAFDPPPAPALEEAVTSAFDPAGAGQK
ncbi:M15 family metallopeptidase [Demequina aestuarii]|uniref:M15 family metallopeptidase n=1 Tax=Demequina aestuarii TaxID=327095 RepID=UPI00078362A6|nr:M15 family metallopeptidase [Demequina aestuarii]